MISGTVTRESSVVTKISAEAKKALLARIEEGKARDFINPMGEVKRQLRCKLGPVEGKKIADAVDKLW